jgi:hypothetical protein
MSRNLLTTAALAPLLLCASEARAETQVTSSSRTTPIATVDSDNTLANNGVLSTNNVSDSIGVLVLGGHAGTVLNSPTISLVEGGAEASKKQTKYNARLVGRAMF